MLHDFDKIGYYKYKELKYYASLILKGGSFNVRFYLESFFQTGNIDTYLLFKELEKEEQEIPGNHG